MDDNIFEGDGINNDDNISEDEYIQEYGNEVNIYNRVGGFFQHNVMGELGTGHIDLDLRDPIQRFTQFTKTVATDMVTKRFIFLKRPDIDYIVDQIQYIKNVKYKNPTAFVLGFYVTTREGTIDKVKFNNLVKYLPLLEYPVRESDVIRYANFWIQTKLYFTG
jgi:hypothetical protein